MAAGFSSAFEGSGNADRAIVLRSSTNNELGVGMTTEAARVISVMEGVVESSAEFYMVTSIDKKATATPANIVLRGVEEAGFRIRPEIRLVEGRLFESGKNEIVAGVKAADQFAGLDVGSK